MDAPQRRSDRLRSFLAEDAAGNDDARFGKIALSLGHVTEAQLQAALDEQKKPGPRLYLGQILLRNGDLTDAQFREILSVQQGREKLCTGCGYKMKFDGEPATASECPRCGGSIVWSWEEPAPSTKLGKYRLIQEIGRGGMGIVYEAEDPDLKRRVALKILREADDDAQALVIRRLHREAAIVAQLRHPNIVGIYEVGMAIASDGKPTHFIAMEYVDGHTLAEILADGKTQKSQLLAVLEDVARGVAHAHASGVIHRDLKPANVLVDRAGRALLTDFGLARAESFETKLTKTNAVMGTPQYMAPEQVQGRNEDMDPRTDVYALGVMLYEILTGRLPYEATTAVEVYRRILEGEPPSPRKVDRDVSSDLERICMKAMDRDRSRRYPSARDFAEDLARYRRGEAVHARPPSLVYRLRKFVIRRRAWVITSAITLVAAALVAYGMRIREFDKAREEARQAFEQRDYARAAGAAERGLRIGDDPDLVAIARASRERLREEEDAQKKKLEKAEKFKSLKDEMAPVEQRIGEMRMLFYVATADDVPQRLRQLERELEDLRSAAHRPEYASYPDVWMVLGKGWYFAGDARRAEEAFLQAVEVNEGHPWAAYYLSRIYLERSMAARLGRTGIPQKVKKAQAQELIQKSREWFRKATIAWESDAEIERLTYEGYLAISEDRRADATKAAQEGLERFGRGPGTEEFLNILGWMSVEVPADQVAYYTEALHRRPHYAWAFLLRGFAYEVLQEFPKARADYESALTLNPRLEAAYMNRGVMKFGDGDLRGAVEDFSQAIALRPDMVAAYFNRGTVRRDLRQYDLALEDFNEAIRLNPDLALAYVHRGSTWERRGSTEPALADYDLAVRVDRECAEAYAMRGSLLRKLNRRAEALQDLDKAIELNPKLHAAYLERATIRHGKGELDLAIADYTEVIKLQPKMTLAWYNRAVARHAKNDLDGAIKDYGEALKTAPKFAPAYCNRGSAYVARNDPEKALADFDQAIALDPNLLEAYYSRGQVHRSLDHREAAIADFETALKKAPASWPHRDQVEKLLAELKP